MRNIKLRFISCSRDSPDKFGGPYCMLIEFSPMLQIVEGMLKCFHRSRLFLCLYHSVGHLHVNIIWRHWNLGLKQE